MVPSEVASAVATALLATPGVARLGQARWVEAATYFPGGKVAGVAVHDREVVAHLVVDRLPLPPVLDAARAAAESALERLGGGFRLDLVVEDLEAERLPGGRR